jgi:hypothetical protein
MIRHTYTYRLEDTGKTGRLGRPEKKRVWDEKIVLPRWHYVLIWTICILLAPLAILIPIAIGKWLSDMCGEGDVRFVYTNKFIEWLKKEV